MGCGTTACLLGRADLPARVAESRKSGARCVSFIYAPAMVPAQAWVLAVARVSATVAALAVVSDDSEGVRQGPSLSKLFSRARRHQAEMSLCSLNTYFCHLFTSSFS